MVGAVTAPSHLVEAQAGMITAVAHADQENLAKQVRQARLQVAVASAADPGSGAQWIAPPRSFSGSKRFQANVRAVRLTVAQSPERECFKFCTMAAR